MLDSEGNRFNSLIAELRHMSVKPVAERLQVKGDRRLAVIGAPAELDTVIGANHARADLLDAEVALLFVRDRHALQTKFPAILRQLQQSAILWVAYPKLTSPLAGDLSRDVVWAIAHDHGLDTVSQIAIDGDWSALRLKRLPGK
jgi:hypothetical protein